MQEQQLEPFPESPDQFLQYLASVDDDHVFFIYGANTERDGKCCPLADWWKSRGIAGYICTEQYYVYTAAEKREAAEISIPPFMFGKSMTVWTDCPAWAREFQEAWQKSSWEDRYAPASWVKAVVQDLGYTIPEGA